MRAWIVLVAACSYAPGAAPGGTAGSDASSLDGAKRLDAPTLIDAAIDADASCLTRATDTFGGHHYFQSVQGTWQLSQDDCAKVGGHLVKIETPAENMFIASTYSAGGGYTWIGLSDPSNTATYVWTDGSALGTYNAFAGTPVASGCVDSNGGWEAYNCGFTGHAGACECE